MSDLLARARAALEGVTPGPWSSHDFGYAHESEPSSIVIHTGEFDWRAIYDGDCIATLGWDAPQDRDARFIAASRQLVPELTAEVERLQSRLKTIEAEMNRRLCDD